MLVVEFYKLLYIYMYIHIFQFLKVKASENHHRAALIPKGSSKSQARPRSGDDSLLSSMTSRRGRFIPRL